MLTQPVQIVIFRIFFSLEYMKADLINIFYQLIKSVD